MGLEQACGETRVVLADLAGPARDALATLLAGIPGVVLVGEVGEAEALHSTIREARPDLLVVDDRLLASATDGATQMIVVGADDNPGYAARAGRLGAIAWIPKERADSLLPVLLFDPTEVSRR
jgi:DNA-binding NarL/FixJ family response regulator